MHRWLVPLLLSCASALAQNEEDVAFLVTGEVVTTAGRACEGANVHLWDALATDRPLAHGTTDKEGKFELTVTLGAIARREHPFGPVRIEASQPGLARVGGPVRPGTRGLRIVLSKPAEWTGSVRDADGNPLPGAPVYAEQGELQFATTTDESGAYRFSNMSDGRIDLGQSTVATYATMIHLRAAGHEQRSFAAAAGEAIDIKLQRAPIARGRVVDATTNEPLSNVRVVALDGSSPVETVTDNDGKFSIELAGRAGRVAAYLAGYGAMQVRAGPPEHEQDYPMTRSAPLEGLVVDEEGTPIAFAEVRLDLGFGEPLPARCDGGGAFEYGIGALDFARVTATQRGYLAGRATIDPGWRADRIRVELPRGLGVKGTVTQDATPLLGAEVVFRGLVPPGVWMDYTRAFANASGEYRALAIPPGATHVFARIEGARSELVAIDTTVDLNVAAKLPLRGTIVDDAASPVGGVAVSVAGLDLAAATTDEAGRFEIADVPIGEHRLAIVEPKGLACGTPSVVAGDPVAVVAERVRGSLKLAVRCSARRTGWTDVVVRSGKMVRRKWLAAAADTLVFANLGAGRYEVELDAVGYIPARSGIDLAVDGPHTVEIQPERAGTLILKGKAGARILVQTLEGQPSPLVSDRLGEESMVVPGFGPGSYRIIARAEGEIIVIREVVVGAKDAPREVDLTGGAESTLVVTVTGEDGQPLEGASIDLVTPSGFVYRTSQRTDREGQATITRLILGPLRVVARSGENRADKGIQIEAGAHQTLAIEIR